MLTRKIEQLDYNEGGTIAINNDMQEEYPIDVRIRRIPEKRILVYNPKNFDVSPILDWLKSKGIQYVHGQNQMFNIGDVFCCEIPKDFINDGPYEERIFRGGLYAIISSDLSRGNKNIARLKQWLSESEIFELDMVEGKLAREQIAEVTTSNDVIEEYMELNDHYLPIRYRENRPVYYLEDVEPKDEVILSKEDIDPRFLYIDEGINSSMDCGNLSIQCHSDYEFVYTPLKYKLPLRIDIEAKTDSSNLRIGYGEAQLIFNWEFGYYYFSCGDPVMRMAKIENSSNSNGYLKEDTFAKISWIIGREYIAVLVNDEVRLCKTGFPYQKLLKDDPSFTFRDQIRICSAFDSIVTIHSLQIIELE